MIVYVAGVPHTEIAIAGQVRVLKNGILKIRKSARILRISGL
jgi:hypothetical protein